MTTTPVTVTYEVHEENPDRPAIAIRMTVQVDHQFMEGWTASTEAPWGLITARANSRDTALLRLVAKRIGAPWH